MNKSELTRAMEIATSDKDLSKVDDSRLFGYGLKDFQPVYTTLDTVAKLIRWQAICLDGTIDSKELDELAQAARYKFQIIG